MQTLIFVLDVSLPGLDEQEKLEFLEQMMPELSEYRQQKVRQIRFLKDKLCSAGVGLLLNTGLKEYGLSGKEERVGFCGNRKPYLMDHPEIHFNLSHSGTMVMAAFADREIGCDIEKNGKADFRVARRFFHEAEQADLEQQPDLDAKTDRFYRYWTLKESFLKVTGEGMRLAMNRFCIRLDEAGCPEEPGMSRNAGGTGETISVELDGIRQPYSFREWQLPGYHAALCVKENPGDVFFSFQNLQDVV